MEERKISPALVIGGGVGLGLAAALVVYALAQAAPPTVYTCPYCGAEFSTQDELNAHILAVHPEVPPPEVAATIQIEVIGAQSLSPATVTEGETYTVRLTVTNRSITAGQPCEAALRIAIEATVLSEVLIPVQEREEYFSANQTRTFDYTMTIPLGLGGYSGSISAAVTDPTGLIILDSVSEPLVVEAAPPPPLELSMELLLESVTHSPSAGVIYEGGAINIVGEVTNLGNYSGSYTLNLYINDDLAYTTRERVILPGQTQRNIYKITDAIVGDYAIRIVANSFEDVGAFHVIPGIPTVGDIAGWVTNASTAEPLEAALVTLNGLERLTNSNGVFEFLGLEPRTYNLSISKEGFHPIGPAPITIEAGEHFSYGYSLLPIVAEPLVYYPWRAPGYNPAWVVYNIEECVGCLNCSTVDWAWLRKTPTQWFAIIRGAWTGSQWVTDQDKKCSIIACTLYWLNQGLEFSIPPEAEPYI